MNRWHGYFLAQKVGGTTHGKVDAGGDESIVADEERIPGILVADRLFVRSEGGDGGMKLVFSGNAAHF